MSNPGSILLHVVHDRSGRILAAAAIHDASEGAMAAPIPMPVAGRGQRLARISMSNLHLAELPQMLERHRIEGVAARARLVAIKPPDKRPARKVAPKRKK
jgi:hypothetical protein